MAIIHGKNYPEKYIYRENGNTYVITKHAYKRYCERVKRTTPRKAIKDALYNRRRFVFVWQTDKEYKHVHFMITVLHNTEYLNETRVVRT